MAEWLDALGDEEALEQARARGHQLDFELWERERFVGRYPEQSNSNALV
jgi:hypothetical protein